MITPECHVKGGHKNYGLKYGGGGGHKNLIIKRLILCGPPLIFLQNKNDPPPIWH